MAQNGAEPLTEHWHCAVWAVDTHSASVTMIRISPPKSLERFLQPSVPQLSPHKAAAAQVFRTRQQYSPARYMHRTTAQRRLRRGHTVQVSLSSYIITVYWCVVSVFRLSLHKAAA